MAATLSDLLTARKEAERLRAEVELLREAANLNDRLLTASLAGRVEARDESKMLRAEVGRLTAWRNGIFELAADRRVSSEAIGIAIRHEYATSKE